MNKNRKQFTREDFVDMTGLGNALESFSNNKKFLKLTENYISESLELFNPKPRKKKVYKNISINPYKDKSGNILGYYGQVPYYRHDGSRTTKNVTGQTESEAYDLARDFQKSLVKVGRRYELPMIPETVTAPSYTVAQWFAEWLTSRINSGQVRDSSIKLYKQRLNRFLVIGREGLPRLGDMELGAVTLNDIENYFNALSSMEWSNGKKYHRETIKGLKVNLTSAFEYAILKEVLDKNVIKGLKSVKGLIKEPSVLQSHELSNMLKSADGHRVELLLNVLAFSGLRIGEGLGLSWKSVSFDPFDIKVTQQLYDGVIAPPKTDYARRTVEMGKSSLLRDMLIAEKDRQMFELGAEFNEDRLILGMKPDGKFWNNQYWYYHIRKFKDSLSLEFDSPDWLFHSLRHTWFTINIARGNDVGKVSRMGGHSKISTTYDKYYHLIPKHGRAVSEDFEQHIFSSAEVR